MVLFIFMAFEDLKILNLYIYTFAYFEKMLDIISSNILFTFISLFFFGGEGEERREKREEEEEEPWPSFSLMFKVIFYGLTL